MSNGLAKWVNYIKLRNVDQYFSLGFKPSRKGYQIIMNKKTQEEIVSY